MKRYLSTLSVSISIATFVVTVFLMARLALIQIKLDTEKSSLESLQTVLITTQEALHIWIRQQKSDIAAVAQTPELITLTLKLQKELRDLSLGNSESEMSQKPYRELLKSHTLHKIRRLISSIVFKNKGQGFFLISKEFINIASTRDEDMGLTSLIYTKRKPYLDQVFKGKTVFVPTIRSDIPFENSNGKSTKTVPALFFVTPIRDGEKKIIAALAFKIDPSTDFTRIAQLGRIGESGETYAFDKSGTLITESRFDHQLKKVGMISPDGNGMLSVKIADPGGNLLEGYQTTKTNQELPLTLMASSALKGTSGHNVKGYRDYRGVPVFGAWLWDHDLNFGLTTEIDEEEAMQSYYSTRLILVLLLIGILILALIFLLLILRLKKINERKLKIAFAQLETKVKERTKTLQSTQEKLQVANRQLEIQAMTDGLTGLANRRCFDNCLNEEIKRCSREGYPISLLMIDVDYFKLYNDTYGHPAGDHCLINIAAALVKSGIASRPGDLIARYGGEEFCIILSGTNKQSAYELAREVCFAIRDQKIPHCSSKVESSDMVTVSIGVATENNCRDIRPQEIIQKADDALYQAKNKGRNQVLFLS